MAAAPPIAASALAKHLRYHRLNVTTPSNRRLLQFFVPVLVLTLFVVVATIPALSVDLSPIIALALLLDALRLDISAALAYLPNIALCLVLSKLAIYAVGPRQALPTAILANVLICSILFFARFVFERKPPYAVRYHIYLYSTANFVLWLDLLFSLGLFPDLKAQVSRSRTVAKARRAARTN